MKRPKLFKSPFLNGGGESLFKRALAMPKRGSLIELMNDCHPPVQFMKLNKCKNIKVSNDKYRNSFRNIPPQLSQPIKRIVSHKLVFEEDKWRSIFYKEYPYELERPRDLEGHPIDCGTSPESIFERQKELCSLENMNLFDAYQRAKNEYLSKREIEEDNEFSNNKNNSILHQRLKRESSLLLNNEE